MGVRKPAVLEQSVSTRARLAIIQDIVVLRWGSTLDIVVQIRYFRVVYVF